MVIKVYLNCAQTWERVGFIVKALIKKFAALPNYFNFEKAIPKLTLALTY